MVLTHSSEAISRPHHLKATHKTNKKEIQITLVPTIYLQITDHGFTSFRRSSTYARSRFNYHYSLVYNQDRSSIIFLTLELKTTTKTKFMLLFGRTNTLYQLMHCAWKTGNYLLLQPGASGFTLLVNSTDYIGVALFLAGSIPQLLHKNKQQ